MSAVNGCGAPEGGVALAGVDLTKEAVIQGAVSRGGAPVPGAFVRLLDRDGEFTAEVQASEAGEFRFFAAPGEWTLRVLAPSVAPVERTVVASRGHVVEAPVGL